MKLLGLYVWMQVDAKGMAHLIYLGDAARLLAGRSSDRGELPVCATSWWHVRGLGLVHARRPWNGCRNCQRRKAKLRIPIARRSDIDNALALEALGR